MDAADLQLTTGDGDMTSGVTLRGNEAVLVQKRHPKQNKNKGLGSRERSVDEFVLTYAISDISLSRCAATCNDVKLVVR